MRWLDAFLSTELVLGIVAGVVAAGVLRWLAPEAPAWASAGLIGVGFLVGLVVAFASGRGSKGN